MKIYITFLLITSILSCQNKEMKNYEDLNFSYSILGKDSLSCNYINLSNVKLELTKEINHIKEGKISLQKFQIENENKIYFYKHTFTNINKLTTIRDEIELYGVKYKIDSLYYGNDYFKKPYVFSSLVNVGRFIFNKHSYIAFFIQDISNPITFPNTLILLFDISDKNKISYIPIGFQASEDLKCFNDFNNDGILDFAKWTQGYDYIECLYRYELNDKNKFVPKKTDFVFIKEKQDGYYIDIIKSKWKYGKINN